MNKDKIAQTTYEGICQMFNIIDNDGFNVGLNDYFAETYLEFDDFEYAVRIVNHWEKWAMYE